MIVVVVWMMIIWLWFLVFVWKRTQFISPDRTLMTWRIFVFLFTFGRNLESGFVFLDYLIKMCGQCVFRGLFLVLNFLNFDFVSVLLFGWALDENFGSFRVSFVRF